jgi:hypothetical protein
MGTCRSCGTTFELHSYHWCHQVCPSCLTPHWIDQDGTMRVDGVFDLATREHVRANIAGNGGRYVPTFERGER